MQPILSLLVFLFIGSFLQAQIISGKITDLNDNALFGTSVYLKGTYDGTTTDSLGNFKFQTSETGEKILVVKFIGYEDSETPVIIQLDQPVVMKVSMHEKKTALNEVVITAGVFEAGDKKRGLQLKTLDILTTANSNGDIAGALNTLPGTQSVGEEGGLFVRGGEKNETKTFVDGMLVSNPYTSKVPDMPSRGRFSPLLFSGVSFSTGGYSAEYGQALSAALILQTPSFPEKSLTSISLFPFGAGVNKTWKGDSASFTAILDYHNMAGYFKAVKQEVDWKKSPEGLGSTFLLRKKIGKSGFFKSFASLNASKLEFELPAYLVDNDNRNLKLINDDIYFNSVYTEVLPSQWLLKAGVACNFDIEKVNFDHFMANTYNDNGQARFVIQKNLNSKLLFKTGAEINFQKYHQEYLQKDSFFNADMHFSSAILGVFAETEWAVSSRLFLRLGSRFEYTGIQHQMNLVPRTALAYKTSDNSQISVAYGTFTELPKDDYLKFNTSLSTEAAAHYVANYQLSINDRMFRAEVFDKEYKHLATFDSILNDPNPAHYQNDGYGYARGLELFLRDRKTLRQGDFWIAYTFMDTKKKYLDIKTLQRPYLFSKHSFSVVGKYFFSKLNSQVGLTYQFTSGRPYYQKVAGEFLNGFTPDIHNVSLNISYLTRFAGNFTIIHFSVNNVLGNNQIYGYHFSNEKDVSGNYQAYPVKAQAKRFFVLGIFVTFDKTSSLIN